MMMTRMRLLATMLAMALASHTAAADAKGGVQQIAVAAPPRTILFLGNSFTQGAHSAVRNWHAHRVTDLNREGYGGVPALFKEFADESGLNYAVSLETQGGQSLTFHYDQRRQLFDRPWDAVVLQEYSTLDRDRPGDPAAYIRAVGLLGTFFRARNPAVRVHLTATWSRADLTYLTAGRWYGRPIAAMADDLRRAADHLPPVAEAAEGDTTYFTVVDADGNCVSGIQSLNSGFGSGVMAGDTGVLLNNRMAYWHLAKGHANRLQPGKRVRHTMNAAMVFKDGKLWASLGTPGADNQVQVNAQVLTAMIDLGADPQTAVESPRWTSSQAGQGANWPHEGDGKLTIEADFGDATLADLAGRGHAINKVAHLAGPCAMQTIRVLDNGLRMVGSDPRRDGWAGAY